MYNLVLLLKNIQNYGLLVVIKIILFEAYYTIKYLDLNSLKYEDKQSNTYEATKNLKEYNAPYIPTPYYFLKIVSDFLKSKKIDNIFFLDLGCGYSRTQYFFSDKFKSFFLGLDIDKNIINKMNKKRIKNSIFLYLDLRKKKNLNKINTVIKKNKKKRELVIFFSDSTEIELLKKILMSISKDFVFKCILINLKNHKIFKKTYRNIFKKNFHNYQRNINIIEPNE
tara:strand:- start:525 stop:1199 length:675 start_codon:yes stop_codon:yes gene_type:complete